VSTSTLLENSLLKNENPRRSFGTFLIGAIAMLFSSSMKRSSIGFLIALLLAFLTLGMTGIGLFFLVTPALNLLFGLKIPLDETGIDQLKGNAIGADAMWPTIILVSMLWSVGFLLAGFVTNKTGLSKLAKPVKNFIYVFTLWTWALCLWAFVIKVGVVR
jgi:hypothetical protein